MDQIIAKKNKNAYLMDAFKIAVGSLFSVVIIAIIMIFRKSIAFIRGKYSMLDFSLLFLILTIGCMTNGIKSLHNHREMPEIMLEYDKQKFYILGDEVDGKDIKKLKGQFEFGRTGTIVIGTESKEYKLYGVKDYASIINSIEKVIIELKK